MQIQLIGKYAHGSPGDQDYCRERLYLDKKSAGQRWFLLCRGAEYASTGGKLRRTLTHQEAYNWINNLADRPAPDKEKETIQ